MELRWGEGRRRDLSRRGGVHWVTTLVERSDEFQVLRHAERAH